MSPPSAPPTGGADPRPAVVVGCGYLGRRVAAAWRSAGRRVVALTRNHAAELAGLGLEPIVGDILDPPTLAALPPASTLLYAVGLDRRAGRSMRDVYVEGLGHVLESLKARGAEPRRFVYVSSTSVYGRTDGGEVTEDGPTIPVEESGRVVLDAEMLLRARLPTAVVLRFAGLYGPGRVIRRDALLRGEPLTGDADKWLNLIHVDDGVRAVLAAETHAAPGGTYNVADGSPVTRREFYTYLANRLGAPAARFAPFSPDTTVPMEANRRVGVRKAREVLGFVPRYPCYVDGLAQALQASGPA